MITWYENFEKILWLSKTLLIQRTTYRVNLLVRTAFESSGTTGRLRIWIPEKVHAEPTTIKHFVLDMINLFMTVTVGLNHPLLTYLQALDAMSLLY